MKTAALVAMFFAGMKPSSTVFVYEVNPKHGGHPLVALYWASLDGKSCTRQPMANPIITDTAGNFSFCAEQGSYRIEVKATSSISTLR